MDSEVDNVANELTEMVVVNMEVDKVANMEVTRWWTCRWTRCTGHLRGSHSLSAQRARMTKSSRLEGPPARSRGALLVPYKVGSDHT